MHTRLSSVCNRERAKNNTANFSGEKITMKLPPWDRKRKRSNCGNLICELFFCGL